MNRAITLSIVDQGILSAQSIVVSLLLIRFTDAEAVGRFALAMSAFFLVLTAQNALVGTPLMTRVFGRSAREQAAILGVVCGFDLWIVAAGALASAAVLAMIGFDTVLIASALGLVVSGLVRELARSVAIATGDMRACLATDAGAVAVSAPALAMLWGHVAPEAACLLAMAAGNAAGVALFGPRLHIAARRMAEAARGYRAYFDFTRWSLVAAIADEIQNRSVLFLVEALRGIAATGIIQVGRLVISPLSLVAMAWGKVTMPRMAAHVRNGERARAVAIMAASMGLIASLVIVYCVPLYFGWSLLEEHLFRGRYPGISSIVLGWVVFSLVAEPLRPLAWLFIAMERLRELALVTMTSAAGALVLTLGLALPVPLHAVLLALALVQVAFAVMLARLAFARTHLREVAT